MDKSALIIGAGNGISGAFARELFNNNYKICLASRNIENLKHIAQETDAMICDVDCTSTESIKKLFSKFDQEIGTPNVVLYNPSKRVKGKITEIEIPSTIDSINLNILGAFVTAQEAAKRMIPKKKGAILFTGATASIKGFPQSSVFAMGKFAIRGLAQSLYRELSPLGIHVAHFVIDGSVNKDPLTCFEDKLSSSAIAKTYFSILNQPKEAWSHEIELRCFTEKF